MTVPESLPAYSIGPQPPTPVWPLGVTYVVPAIDGARVAPALWTPPGAWGCWRAHLSLWEQMLSLNEPCRVILEHDAVTRPEDDFVGRLVQYLSEIPAGADLVYFGGESLGANKIPDRITEHVRQVLNVNRTHAYMVVNTPRTLAVYHRLCTMKHADNGKMHIDWVLGDMQASGKLTAYVPNRWFFGQAAGKSLTKDKTVIERWWDLK